ncbi:MAG: apolipoprotein N-acyltransferase [Rhodospirillaceae bacterium]|nr:apolipoprotein N-acyltransferase [Rhodospirillaceae bacterium]
MSRFGLGALHARLLTLKLWQRLILSFLCGALATLAMPPWHAVPLLWIAFPMLLWLLEGCRSGREALALGWSFGFGHFATGLTWITHAFYVDAETHGAFAVPAIGALAAAFAFYIGAVAWIVNRIPHEADGLPYDRTPTAAMRALAFALAWAASEWVRGWLLTGFPWNPMASVWTAWPAMIQVTAVIGTLGLSCLTVGAAALASVAGPAPRSREAWLIAGAPLALLALIGAGGWLRLSLSTPAEVPGVVLRLVQPNISQADKWRPGLRDQHFLEHIRLSTTPSGRVPTHVIWGEAAVAFALDRDETRRRMAAAVAPAGGLLITGVPRAAATGGDVEQVFNSMLAIRPDASVAAVYDKVHLVPFGEYLPLRGLIPFKKLTEGTMDFSAGPERATLALDGLPPFSPLICYEAIFSGAVTGPPAGEQRAQWLLNITNDSWFGDSSGPHQHLAAAQLRAAEEGLPLVRVANTGISAVIDPYGRVLGRIDLNVKGVLDAPLPAVAEFRTPFNAAGQLIPLILIALATTVLIRWIRRHGKRSENRL